jgi:outer membrane protein assembly factor BamB
MKKVGLLAALLFLSPSVWAADWTQFRGPGGSGVSPEVKLPPEWSADKGIRWKVALPGRGLSNPVIADGRIFVTAASGFQQKRLHVFCFEESTGKKLWERQFWATAPALGHPKTNMAAPTPVTDGQKVYALFANQDLVALDRDGNLLWYRSLSDDYPTIANNVGMASSPVLWQDVVIVDVCSVIESFAVGIDARTGQNKWRIKRKQDINWTTPLVFEANGKPQVVLQNGDGLTARDPATGKELWHVKAGLAPIASPAFSDGLVLAPGGKFLAVKPGDGGKKEPAIAWDTNKLPGSYAAPLCYQGKVYAVAHKGVLRCADLQTGAPVWDLRLEGDFAASPVAADGKLYFVSEEGTTYVVDAAKPNILHANALADKILATPVIANGAIYLRSDAYLYCIGSKQ